MDIKWSELLECVSEDTQHGKEILGKLPFLAGKCFLSPEAENCLKQAAESLLSVPGLLANYTKVLAVLEEGICSSFSGRVNDSLLNGPFPADLCGNIPEEIFFLLLALSCIPAGEKAFIRKNLPVEKLYEALDEYGAWSRNCFRNHGVHGLKYSNGFAWLVFRILPGIVLRFGRLEYNHSLAFPDILVFRHRKSGQYRVLLNGKYEVNKEGKIAAKGEETNFITCIPRGIFGAYTAFPVSEEGRIEKETVSVDLQEYELILRPGDEVIYMHIPELGPLTPEEVEESFIKVREFYKRKDSSYHPKGIICGSWLFDPVLQELLPENANLPLFQKSGYLLPPKSASCDVVYRVFGVKAEKEGIDKVEWKSSLQKILGNYLSNGGIFRGGRYFRMF
ncbi:MAG: hypothetical protein IKA79_04800 [Lentisphaeria bacterium]|nr:hypothetical protein [Lentisphaeria bacterium]